MDQVELNALEQDAFEVICLVRSVKNSLAPINRIPPEILSLVPDHYDKDHADQDLIALTHVCRTWRVVFISRSSLWTNLDFVNVDKARTYIQRSKSSPLEIFLDGHRAGNTYFHETFALAAPHIRRFKSLAIRGHSLTSVLEHFSDQAPLPEKLDIGIAALDPPTLQNALFNGDLSPWRGLTLGGVVTSLPWSNLLNLTMFKLSSCPPGPGFVTQLLDVFECAPLLHTIVLEDSIPMFSDAPPGRMVSLPHLKKFTITAMSGHVMLLKHLRIPPRVSLTLRLNSDGTISPLQELRPETFASLIGHPDITAIYILLDAIQKNLRLVGPNGGVDVLINRGNYSVSRRMMDHRVLRSISPHFLSTTQKLVVSEYEPSGPAHVEYPTIFRTISYMNKLRTLVLNSCHNRSFVLALNPGENSHRNVLCPDLEELILYIRSQDQFNVGHLLTMAKGRALRGVKLASITIVGPSGLEPAEGLFNLREHVTCVDYKVDDVLHGWISPQWGQVGR